MKKILYLEIERCGDCPYCFRNINWTTQYHAFECTKTWKKGTMKDINKLLESCPLENKS